MVVAFYLLITNQQRSNYYVYSSTECTGIIMTLLQARIKARKYSDQYNTSWFVRKISNTDYQPWAHSSEHDDVASFYCGKDCGKDDF
jgi:hypothetical protein